MSAPPFQAPLGAGTVGPSLAGAVPDVFGRVVMEAARSVVLPVEARMLAAADVVFRFLPSARDAAGELLAASTRERLRRLHGDATYFEWRN